MENFIMGKRVILVAVVASAICLAVFNTSLDRDGTGPVLVYAPRAGMFRSVVWKSFRKNRPFHSFISIPYALPPTGKLRFQPPVPMGLLEGVHDSADQVEVKCMQTKTALEEPTGQEDCLYLHVFSPLPILKTGPFNSSTGLPVIIFIHGGFFTFGNAGTKMIGPQKLMDEDIILVTVNYRLGVLGFLTLENEYAPGNLGLRDQQLAMEWVKANIWFFGGDPGRVTLMGQSAGSMAVSYHMVSPRAKNLFHGAIMMSGTCTNSVLEMNLSPRMYTAGVATALGCLRSSLEIESIGAKGSIQLLDCLVKVPSKEIIKFNSYFTISLLLSGPLVFAPVPDGSWTSDPVLPSDPASMLKTGQFNKVPVMTGTMEQEGAVFGSAFIQHPELWDFFKQQWQGLGPLVVLGRSTESTRPGDNSWVTMMTSEYFGKHEDDSKFELQRLVTLLEDKGFSYPQRKFVELISQDPEMPPVYSYVISHRPTAASTDILLPRWKLVLKILTIRLLGMDIGFSMNMGASHVDDLLLIFSLNIPVLKDVILHTPDDFRISQTLISYLVNFASSGNPNIGLDTLNSATWIPVSWPDNFDYLNISSKKTFEMMYDKDRNRREELWRQLDVGVGSYKQDFLRKGVVPLSRLDFLHSDIDVKAERDYFGGAYLRNVIGGLG